MYYIVTNAYCKDMPIQLGFWVICGPFYLLMTIFIDMFNFLSVLSDYKNENDKTKQMMAEDDM